MDRCPSCTDVLLQYIGSKQWKQNNIALAYAMVLKSWVQGADDPDWEAINKAIITRWSVSGLKRVKRRAWDILAGKIRP